jgi:anti-sigma B factor antagonist
MSESSASLSYTLEGGVAWIKVTGRANCVIGAEFLSLVQELRAKEIQQFALDLRECVVMDSSFLGTLAGLEQEFGLGNLQAGTHVIELLGANVRVAELIRNLGLDEYFRLKPQHSGYPEQWIPVPPSASRTSRLECSKVSLEAHEVIVRLNPANEAKFRDVVNFLKEDIKRLEGGGEGP